MQYNKLIAINLTTMLIITFHYYNLVFLSYYTRTKITLEIITFDKIILIIIHVYYIGLIIHF